MSVLLMPLLFSPQIFQMQINRCPYVTSWSWLRCLENTYKYFPQLTYIFSLSFSIFLYIQTQTYSLSLSLLVHLSIFLSFSLSQIHTQAYTQKSILIYLKIGMIVGVMWLVNDKFFQFYIIYIYTYL